MFLCGLDEKNNGIWDPSLKVLLILWLFIKFQSSKISVRKFEILNNSRYFELEKNIIELDGKICWVREIVKFELAPNAQSETLWNRFDYNYRNNFYKSLTNWSLLADSLIKKSGQ